MQKTVKGIIVREVLYGEADKLLNILTPDMGLLTVGAKRSRRIKNNTLLSAEVLTYGEFVLGGSESTRWYLNALHPIQSFEEIRQDIVLLTYCAHAFELIMDTLVGTESSADIFLLTLHFLDRMSRKNPDPKHLIHVFELKLLFLLGFTPLMDECCVCKKKIGEAEGEKRANAFDFSLCGVVCSSRSCRQYGSHSMTVLPSVLKALNYISLVDIDKVFSFEIPKEAAEQLYDIASRYTVERLEKNYDKLKMLEDFVL